jgi:transposase
MPAERAPIRKVREVLRLKYALGVSERQIANTVDVRRSTVGEYLRRAAVVGVTWPVPEGMDDGELERRLFTPPTFDEKPARPLPDWMTVHSELKRRSVTLLLLLEEYRAEHG